MQALSLVVWPPKGSRLVDVPLEPQSYSDELRAEIRARHAAGETTPELAQKLGIPFASVKAIACRLTEKKRQQRAREREAAESGRAVALVG